MPIEIDFYLLNSSSLEESLPFVCRLVEKAYNQSHQIFILTETLAETQKLNDQLWTFRDVSFVPHDIYQEQQQQPTPAAVQIACAEANPQPPHNDILINLTTNAPDYYNDFNRVLEVVPNDNNLKAAARMRYKHYQANNYKTTTHNINI
ncbi:MAG: DNA polymerase III subunit chi [Gammaproteobacteria bacterium]|nr:DNA polymerase III subunit chi [Gammaproteobacteria bacterium]